MRRSALDGIPVRQAVEKREERTVTENRDKAFDFEAFKEAFERKDLERWAPFYADEGEWTEYRHISPPRAPIRMIGKKQIADFLAWVCNADFRAASSLPHE
jgi:hypothetical protein